MFEMTREVKRCKNSNGLSEKSSSSGVGDPCFILIGSSLNDGKTMGCSLDITPGEQVSGIDWIREQISYLINNNKNKTSKRRIQNLRLVQKSWLSTITKLLKKCKDPPLIELTLDNVISYDFDPVENIKENKKKLDHFIELFGVPTRPKESFLPFKLKLESDFFRYENFKSLREYFTRFGNELFELDIMYPLDGGNMPVYFPPLQFHILRKMSFQFSGNFHVPLGDKISNFEDNRYGLWLLQSILNATKGLHKLDLLFEQGVEDDLVPATFQFLQLPLSIVSTTLELELDSETLETLFLRNQFPNLKQLTFRLREKPYKDGLMYKILEHVRKTLVSFVVGGLCSDGRPYPRTYFRFPVMEKLEKINIASTECELDAEQSKLIPLPDHFPKLKRAFLTYQTEAMLKKWASKSKFEGVHSLGLLVVNRNLSVEQNNYFRSLSLETMTKLNAAFPNVKDLTLHLNIGFLNVLKYVFADMTRLNFLDITLHGNIQRNTLDVLDSVFTGLPISLIGSLKQNSVDILKSVLVLTNESQISICNLTGLTSIILNAEKETGEADQVSLISDLLFGQAFMKMPKLLNLYLGGKFQPSESMQKIWKEQGRFINYIA